MIHNAWIISGLLLSKSDDWFSDGEVKMRILLFGGERTKFFLASLLALCRFNRMIDDFKK